MLLSAVFLIVLIASCAISSSAYLGVNGNMVWRQSDSIAQILSFSGWKGLSPMDDFLGRPSWYATPVYELIVSAAAGITRISGPQGFLTAAVFTDLACFWLLLFSGYRLAEKISDGSGLWLIFLLSVSPLYLHYYSVPIPDTMALALSVTAVSLLTGECRGILRQSAALLALSVACFIKSPVPFVLMVFFPSRELLLGHLISRRKLLITVSLVALLSALLPEYLRNSFLRSSGAFFAQDPEWYFGTLDDRLSARFWKTMVNRVTKAAPFRVVGGFLAISSAAAFIWCVLKRRLSASIPFAAAFLSGWLVFAMSSSCTTTTRCRPISYSSSAPQSASARQRAGFSRFRRGLGNSGLMPWGCLPSYSPSPGTRLTDAGRETFRAPRRGFSVILT